MLLFVPEPMAIPCLVLLAIIFAPALVPSPIFTLLAPSNKMPYSPFGIASKPEALKPKRLLVIVALFNEALA